MRRILRHWAKANGKRWMNRATYTSRPDPVTGEVLRRRLSRWHGRFVRGQNGFVAVNDGPAFAAQMNAALAPRMIGPRMNGAAVQQITLARIQAEHDHHDAYRRALGLDVA